MLMQVSVSLVLAMGLSGAPPEPEKITMDQAVKQVQKNTGGRVLSADRVRSRHGDRYRIKTLMKNGRIRVIQKDSTPDPQADDMPSSKQAAKEKH